MENKNLFLIYLGRSGAGPKLTLDFAKEIIYDNEIKNLNLLISKNNLLKEEVISIKNDTFVLDTPISNKDAVLKLPSFLFKFIKILITVKKNKNKNFLFFMTHIWNPVSMILIKIIIPKSNIFYVSHDANIHPGEKNSKLQYSIMQLEIFLSNKIITLTNNVKNILQKRWGDKEITVLEHPVYDFGKIEEIRKLKEVTTFLFFGRMVKYKGLDLFLKALEIFDKEINKKYKVIIAGEGEIKDYNITIIKKLNKNEEKIELINRYINEKEIPEIWDRSDICVLPYIEASQSGVIAIAINKAMPCIITPMDGLIEQCTLESKSMALISKDTKAEEFSKSMLEILNEDIYIKLSKNAIDLQDKYSWKKWINEIIK
ncbi:MAG: hypothetical protein QG630_478 [Patescibacteria group bacterium]|nr:hypothetical protein [Patescibacteria group bacterium]